MKLVNLELPKTGFRNFISAWIFVHNQKTFIVDPGPRNSLHHLTKALDGQKPDYILLTHIHIDHAGGVGELHNLYPEAKFVCFNRAKKHLVNPEKLIQGSKFLGGDLMQIYGEITAVSENSVIEHQNFSFDGIDIIETPGHASHHISFLINQNLFCGEALGVIFDNTKYLRPACPPPFKIYVYLESIKKLEKLKAKKLCFGHYGLIDRSDQIFKTSVNQIKLWAEVIKNNPENAFENLIERDSNFALFNSLPEDIQQREKIFIANSIAGIKALD